MRRPFQYSFLSKEMVFSLFLAPAYKLEAVSQLICILTFPSEFPDNDYRRECSMSRNTITPSPTVVTSLTTIERLPFRSFRLQRRG